jgi:hypothetical protein
MHKMENVSPFTTVRITFRPFWPANCCLCLQAEKGEGSMKIVTKEKAKVLAEQNGWTTVHAEGYIEGERARRRGLAPSKFLMVGIDEYALGFRAGYFAADRKRSAVKQAST